MIIEIIEDFCTENFFFENETKIKECYVLIDPIQIGKKYFICSICDKIFNLEKKLKKHKMSHNESQSSSKSHNQSERNRRENINTWIRKLSLIVPQNTHSSTQQTGGPSRSGGPSRPRPSLTSKANILAAVYENIIKMETIAERNQLKIEREKLKQENEKIRKLLSDK